MYPKAYSDYFRRFERKAEVFVAMPISPESEHRWRKIFVPAIKQLGLRPYRSDLTGVSDSILIEILQGIGRAKCILFDISNQQSTDRPPGPSANVMYELGLAHSLRLPEEVIVVRADKSDGVPFDIRHIRWTRFDSQKEQVSIRVIKRLINDAERQLDLTRDLIVERTLKSLDVDMIWFLDTVRNLKEFDLYPFDLERKGLYELGYRESSEVELRSIARQLIMLGVLEVGKFGHPSKGVYGGRPEYLRTSLGGAVLQKLELIQADVLAAPQKTKAGGRKRKE